MTITSTPPTISSLLSSPFPQWQPATWEDYIGLAEIFAPNFQQALCMPNELVNRDFLNSVAN